jgi:hypothetical protein
MKTVIWTKEQNQLQPCLKTLKTSKLLKSNNNSVGSNLMKKICIRDLSYGIDQV